jgi:hypothetical protein
MRRQIPAGAQPGQISNHSSLQPFDWPRQAGSENGINDDIVWRAEHGCQKLFPSACGIALEKVYAFGASHSLLRLAHVIRFSPISQSVKVNSRVAPGLFNLAD